jgi:hypothetical protein
VRRPPAVNEDNRAGQSCTKYISYRMGDFLVDDLLPTGWSRSPPNARHEFRSHRQLESFLLICSDRLR